MTNEQVMAMVERFHKPAQNVKIKAAYVMIGIGLIGVAYFAIRASSIKSKEIRELKDVTSKNLVSIKNLTSKTAMLEHDLQQNESIIETLNNDKKELIAKLDDASNKGVLNNTQKI
jgi:hypothetical protein